MKKLIRNAIIITVLFVAHIGQANSKPNLETEPSKTSFRLKDLKRGQKIFIKNINGLVVFKSTLEGNGKNNNTIDLTSLPDGNYTIELDDDVQMKITPFFVDGKNVKFIKESESILFKPVVFKRKNLVYITRISPNKSKLNYKIYFEDETEHFLSEQVRDEKSFGKIYDFRKAEKGSYKIVFKTDGRTFTKKINIK